MSSMSGPAEERPEDGLKQPLLPEKNKNLSDPQACEYFLLRCEPEQWYKGGIYKEQVSLLTIAKSAMVFAAGYMEFISHKFKHTIDGKEYTFCITFRKKHNSFFRKPIDKYHIRLSILNPDREQHTESELTDGHLSIKRDFCYKKNALKLKSKSNDSYLKYSAYKNGKPNEDNLTSVTTGQYRGNANVSGMEEFVPEKDNMFVQFYNEIQDNMNFLGEILVKQCFPEQVSEPPSTPTEGGATRRHKRLTRRRKRLIGRKGTKSYRKKIYAKTKKSRRFRRSVRSRR